MPQRSRGRPQDPSRQIRRAVAEAAFLKTASCELPSEAFQELFDPRHSDVAAWAKRWRVDAPCMLTYATELLVTVERRETGENLSARIVGGKLRFSSGADGRPRRWALEVARLDRLPPSYLRQGLSDRVTDSFVSEYRKTELSDDEDALAPVSADPAIESKERFLQRAEEHFAARANRMKRICAWEGPVRLPPSLLQHTEWLVRFQLRNETFLEIAAGVRWRTDDPKKVVEVAVRRLAALIELSLRPLRRGRPPAPAK